MAAQIKIDKEALAELKTSSEVEAIIGGEADKVCARANATLEQPPTETEYDVEVHHYPNQVMARVIAVGIYARRSNAIRNTLLRVLNG